MYEEKLVEECCFSPVRAGWAGETKGAFHHLYGATLEQRDKLFSNMKQYKKKKWIGKTCSKEAWE